MCENKTFLTKEEIVNSNPTLKRSIITNYICGAILIFISIFYLAFMEGEEVSTSIMFLILGVLLIVLAIVTPIVSKKNKRVPDSIEYNYIFNEESFTVTMITPEATSDTTVHYAGLYKYKFKNNLHYLFANKYVYYVVKDEFDSEEAKNFFLSKVSVK